MRFYSLILGTAIILTTQASELDAQSSGYFPIGVWCTDFDPEGNPLAVTTHERDLIRDLGITYLIACPEFSSDEEAIADFTDDEMNAGRTLKTNISYPYNKNYFIFNKWGGTAEKYILPPNNQDRIDWINGVESDIENVDTNYAFRPGFADILIHNEDNRPDSVWAGYNFIAQVIDSIRNATGSNAKSLLVISPTGGVYPEVIENIPDADIIMPFAYPFLDSIPYSGINDQGAFDEYTSIWSNAISSIQTANGATGDMIFHPAIQAYADSNTVTQQMVHRFPTPEEFLASVNIALSYGAKGITFYLYDSRVHIGDDLAVGLVSDTIPRQPSGMYYTVKDVIDNYLSKISQEYLSLDWQSAFTSGETPPSGSVVTGISGASHIEIGNFTHQQSGESYFLLVNRVTNNTNGTPADPQTFTVTLESGAPRRLIEDVLASREPWDGNTNRVAYRLLSSSETDFTVELKPGEGRLFRVSTLALQGTITEDRYWSGDVWIHSTLTISSGITLEISPGTTNYFNNGAKLLVKGQLIAEGTPSSLITFRSINDNASPSSWWWIHLDFRAGPEAPSSIKYAHIQDANYGVLARLANNTVVENNTIENCRIGVYSWHSTGTGKMQILNNQINNLTAYGLYVYNSDPIMKSNTVTNVSDPNINFGYGIYLNYSEASLKDNIVTGSALEGVYATGSGEMSKLYYHATLSPDGGGNTITSNLGHGVYVTDSAAPILGWSSGTPGNNIIYNNSGKEIYNNTSSAVKATCNDWNGDPLITEFFGVVHYDPWIGSNGVCDQYSALPANPLSGWLYAMFDVVPEILYAQSNGITNRNKQATKALTSGNYEEALRLYKEIIRDYPDSKEVFYTLTLSSVAFKVLGRKSEFRPYLAQLLNQQSDTEVKRFAKRLMMHTLIGSGELNEALAIGDDILLNNPSDEEVNEVLFRQAMILESLDDIEASRLKFEEIITRFRGTEYASFAAVQMEFLDVDGLKKGAIGDKSFDGLRPKNYSLSNNYPNPFNPVTRIEFALPEAGLTRLIIYDIRGREVAILIDGEMSAGFHNVTWDASKMASGIYFYRMTSGSFVNTKKMLLLK